MSLHLHWQMHLTDGFTPAVFLALIVAPGQETPNRSTNQNATHTRPRPLEFQIFQAITQVAHSPTRCEFITNSSEQENGALLLITAVSKIGSGWHEEAEMSPTRNREGRILSQICLWQNLSFCFRRICPSGQMRVDQRW